MGLSEEVEDETELTGQTFVNLCMDLNMDRHAKDEAWTAFQRIGKNYTLEGKNLHWLACALYVSCRRSRVPTVGRGVVEGNCVSLTRLLRSTKLSLIEFFNKMRKWADMANLPQDFRDSVGRLERNFNVSTVIFKKFQPIFMGVFQDPENEAPKLPRGRKQRRLPCTASDVFKFTWTMFVQVKGNFPAISDDLVNSYHLLLCCIDWVYGNALLSNRKDLLSLEFEGLPSNFSDRDFKPPSEVPCTIQLLCDKHEGLSLEAKGIKEHWWKPYMKKLFERRVLKGKAENLTGILELGHFECNSKAINLAYEEFVLNVGDFDERIFLGKDAALEMGTPMKNAPVSNAADLSERMQATRNLRPHFDLMRSLTPSTPLSGRAYLKDKQETYITPVTTATQSVSRLQSMLAGRKTSPSDALIEIFKECSRNPHEEIIQRVEKMAEIFCTKYTQPSEDFQGSQIDFAKRRLQLGEGLYYKLLENIMQKERQLAIARTGEPADFSNMLERDIFHQSLFTCCLEIVIFSYNYQRTFPWIIEIFGICSYHFYKVIELLIRAEDGLSRDVIKHLNHIEESILESLAFKSDSPMWDAIEQHEGKIPSVEEVSLPNQIEKDPHIPASSIPGSKLHPQIRKFHTFPKDPLLSPTGPSAVDRFSSPMCGSAKRRLFDSNSPQPDSKTTPNTNTDSKNENGNKQPQTTIYTLQHTADGHQMLVPYQVKKPSATNGATASENTTQNKAENSTVAVDQAKPKKMNSVFLFFRKVYHMASLRLRELSEKLDIDLELMSRIWTCFEYCIQNHTELLKDRHLDQIIMCSVYVLAKVTGKNKSFQDIMKFYRLQPQANSHVYRSVLLTSRKRRPSSTTSSSSSKSSRNGSPVPDAEDRDKKRVETLSTLIRSTSTLPAPVNPSSQPPTPTRLAGTGSTFEYDDRGEDRGDLVTFYNQIFLKHMETFSLKFSAFNQENGETAPLLSPLPRIRPHTHSPRRVSSKHEVYISPIKHVNSSPRTKLLYCFNNSPANVGSTETLGAINRMVKSGKGTTRKISLQDPIEDEASPAKRHCAPQVAILGRLMEIQEANEKQAMNRPKSPSQLQ